MIIIFVVGARPRPLKVLNQSWNLGVKTADVDGDRPPQPVGIAAVGNLESANLGKEPGDKESNRGGHDKSWWAAEGRLAKRRQGGRDVSRLGLAERFDGTNVAGEKSKHGDSDTALPWQTQKWQLKKLGRGSLVIAGRP